MEARSQNFVGHHARRVRPRHLGGRAAHRPHPVGRRQQRSDLVRQARAVELGIGHHDGGAGTLHVAGVQGLVVGAGVRVGHQHRGQPGGRHLQDRAA